MSGDGETQQQIQEETKAMPKDPQPTPGAPKSVELTDAALESVSGGAGTKLTSQRHEMLKSIVQSLRG